MEEKDNSDDKIVKEDDIKDNTNDDTKTYESKENVEQSKDKSQIPQNTDPKPLGQRNKIVIGSFEPSTFHYSFKNQKDPLQIGMFPVFGYLQIPHIGVYGDSYGIYNVLISTIIRKWHILKHTEPTQLRALLELSMSEKLVSSLPKSVSNAIKEIMSKVPNNKHIEMSDIFNAYAIVHECPPYKETQHFSLNANNLFNVMYHSWLYHELKGLDKEQQIEDSLICGLFEPLNVYQIRNDPNKVKNGVDRGIPFNKLEERSCFLHGFAFSPCNCDIARDVDAGYCAFYMIAVTKDYKRACLSYHIFANNGDMDEILKWTFKETQTVKQLLTTFESLTWGNIAHNLHCLCQYPS